MHSETLTLRTTGLAASLILTLAAYFVIIHPEFFHLETKTALITIFVLAVLQFIVQFIFFLDLWREKGPRWNLGVFLATLSILITIVVFSIWIMNHLNANMMG